ncbi:hypothetical protein CI238_12699, partial [Colletotrichum incanum]
ATQQQNKDPIHPFTRFISRNRFQLLLRRLRIFNTSKFQSSQSDGPGLGRAQAEALMPDVYRKVNEWSAHIQETGDSFYTAGTDITVDKAMVRFTGRSFETTTILAQSGYCLRWLWHVHGKGPYGLVPQARPAPDDKVAKQALLTPTQRVVTTLVTLLPAATYYIFLDNLFSSVRLFRALRKLQVGASGTCRVDSGIDRELVVKKDTKGQGILWGKIHYIPTSDREVNQFSWKDNALMLFLTTVFKATAEEQVIRARRRPAGDTATKRAARQVFGPEVRKDLPVPIPINQYNHKMGGVDISDQIRSYYQYCRPIRQGGWQSIT